MRSVAKLALTVATLAVLVGVSAGPALAATATSNAGLVSSSALPQRSSLRLVSAPSGAEDPGDSAGSAAADGTNINKQRHDADAAHTKNKLIIGLTVVVLLVIVYFGHRQRAKSRVRKKNLQHAKS